MYTQTEAVTTSTNALATNIAIIIHGAVNMTAVGRLKQSCNTDAALEILPSGRNDAAAEMLPIARRQLPPWCNSAGTAASTRAPSPAQKHAV